MTNFGWSLPPGCSINDIPGNRPEDMKEEALADEIYSILEKNKSIDEQVNKIIELVWKERKEVADGIMADQKMEEDMHDKE